MNRDEHRPDKPREAQAFENISGDSLSDTEHLSALRVPVWLAQTLWRVRVPSSEMNHARSRVEKLVFANIPRSTSRLARKRLKRRVGLALALSAISAAVWISMLAASALPSSPLYTVKRGEEWLAYQTAWSNGRRGDVLLLAANRRLEEAETVADVEQGAAVGLALDLRGNLLELIGLYQSMNITQAATDETQSIKTGLVWMLSKESDAAKAAELSGNLMLADTLRENARLARDALSSRHLQLP